MDAYTQAIQNIPSPQTMAAFLPSTDNYDPNHPLLSYLKASGVPLTADAIQAAAEKLSQNPSTAQGVGADLRALLGVLPAVAQDALPNVSARPMLDFAKGLFDVGPYTPSNGAPAAAGATPPAPAGAAPPQPAPSIPSIIGGRLSMGGGGGMGSSPALKLAQDAMGKLSLDLPQQTSAVADYTARRAALGDRPDSESDTYDPLQGKRLSNFMVNMGLNMMANNHNRTSFVQNLGTSAGVAKQGAEAAAQRQYTSDTDKWKDRLADMQLLVNLGQVDHKNLSEDAKAKYDAARGRVDDLIKLGTAQTTDAFHRGMLGVESQRNQVMLGKTPAQKMQDALDFAHILQQQIPGLTLPQGIQMAMKGTEPSDPNAKYNDAKYQSALSTLQTQFKDLSKANPGMVSAAAMHVAQGEGTLEDWMTKLGAQK